MAAAFAAAEVARQLDILYFHADPSAKQQANSYLMQFQEDASAWSIAQELLQQATPHVQFMGAQTLYLKVRRQWGTLPEKASFIARLFVYLRDTSGTLLEQTCLKLALCVSALAVRSAADWSTAMEDIVHFGRDSQVPRGRYLATQILSSMPDEIQNLLPMTHVKSSLIGQALVMKSNLVVVFLLECLKTLDTKPQGLCEVSLQCLVQWTKTLAVRFCEDEALGCCLIDLLSVEDLVENVLEVFMECLQNSSMASSMWKVKDWENEAPGRRLLANGAEGKYIRALMERLRGLHPRLVEVCSGTSAPGALSSSEERKLCAWARVVLMFCESYTQLLFEADCEFLLHFLGCCFRLSPVTAQPLFEFWGQVKELHREELLKAPQVRQVLLQLTEPCIVSLLRYTRRDSSFSAGAPEELSTFRDMAKDVVCDIYCLWQRCDNSRTEEFVGFLSQHFAQKALTGQDMVGAEAALVLLESIVDVMESPLPGFQLVEIGSFLVVLRCIPKLPTMDVHVVGAAALLLQRCAPHVNTHTEVLPDSLDFLIRALPLVPFTAAESLQDLTGYAGHHLSGSLQKFLAAVAQMAPDYPVKVDSTLFSAVVCTMRRLSTAEAVPAFLTILQGTLQQLLQLDGQIVQVPNTGTNGGRSLLVLPEASRPLCFRLLARLRICIWTLEQTPDDPDGPPPTGGTASAGHQRTASCVLAALVPFWDHFARVVEGALTPLPTDVSQDTPQVKSTMEKLDQSYNEAGLAMVSMKLLRSCIATAKSPMLSSTDAARFVQMLLRLLVAVAHAHQQGLSLLADFVEVVVRHHPLQEEMVQAYRSICSFTLHYRLNGNNGSGRGVFALSPEAVTPLFELVAACSSHLESAVYGDEMLFSKLQVLALESLRSNDRDLNRSTLQFLLRFANSSDVGVQKLFQQLLPRMASAVLQYFHLWPQATRKHSSALFALLLERHGAIFQQTLVEVWSQPGTSGVHLALSSQEREACAYLFEQLRGPRLKAFLGDLAAIANGAQTVDVLVSYQLPLGGDSSQGAVARAPMGGFCGRILPEGSASGAVFNIASATLGAGALSLPYAFRCAGVLFALVWLSVAACATVTSIRLLLIVSRVASQRRGYVVDSYEDIAAAVFGQAMRHVVEATMIIFCFGTAVAYCIAVGDILEPVRSLRTMPSCIQGDNGRELVMLGLWFILMLPLSLLPFVGSLRFASFLGVLAIAVLVIAIVYHCVGDHLLAQTLEPGVLGGVEAPANVFSANFDMNAANALSLIMFAFTCQVNVYDIYRELSNPSEVKMMKITRVGIWGICFLVYAIVGVFGYLDFGSDVHGNILRNLQNDVQQDAVIASAFVCIALTIVVAFPLNIFPCRESIFSLLWGPASMEDRQAIIDEVCSGDQWAEEHYVVGRTARVNSQGSQKLSGASEPLLSSGETSELVLPRYSYHAENYYVPPATGRVYTRPLAWQRTFVSFMISVAAIIMALLIPKIEVVFSLLGACCSSFLAFVFPAMCFKRLQAEGGNPITGPGHLAVNSLLWGGAAAGILSTGLAVYSLVQG